MNTGAASCRQLKEKKVPRNRINCINIFCWALPCVRKGKKKHVSEYIHPLGTLVQSCVIQYNQLTLFKNAVTCSLLIELLGTGDTLLKQTSATLWCLHQLKIITYFYNKCFYCLNSFTVVKETSRCTPSLT